jgi:hypothetical protein
MRLSLQVPKFRSRSRDTLNDERRVALIRNAVESAIQDAERERSGLLQRIEVTRNRAGALLGDDVYGSDIGPDSHARLRQCETILTHAERRVVSLDRLISHLRDVKSILYNALPSSQA